MTNYTNHATVRAQQRGVPPLVVRWLLEYGRVTRRRGAEVYYLDKRGRRALQRDIGRLAYKRMADLLDVYAVMSDNGDVITVAPRKRRVRQ